MSETIDQNHATLPEKSRKWSSAVSVGSILSAFLASTCCAGPLVFALLGVGGVGFLVRFEPYRAGFTAVTVAFLAAAFYLTYRRPNTTDASKVASAECTCPAPKAKRSGKIGLWIATLIAVGLLGFSYVAPWLFG
jgi:mercuric ion transport protein